MSPMQAVNEPSTEHRAVEPRQPVEAWLDHPDHGEPRWVYGLLREWARYPSHGWTATVAFEWGSSHGLGRFLAEHVRADTVDRVRGR